MRAHTDCHKIFRQIVMRQNKLVFFLTEDKTHKTAALHRFRVIIVKFNCKYFKRHVYYDIISIDTVGNLLMYVI